MTAIKEAKDLKKMDLDELLESLMKHEITLKINEESGESKKKRKIAFKTSSIQDSDKIKMMIKVMRIWLSSHEDSKCSRNANSLKDKEGEILTKMRSKRRTLIFALNTKSSGT